MKVYYCEHGIFPAKYNFRDLADDTAGTDNPFIDVEGHGVDCSDLIVASEDGHKKVLKLIDAGAASKFDIDHNLDTVLTDGWFEYWVKFITGTANSRFFVQFKDSGDNNLIGLYMMDDHKWDVLRAGGSDANLGSWSEDTWHHVAMYYKAATPTCTIYIDGISIGTFTPISTNSLYRFHCESRATGENTVYLDAIGYTSDTNYNAGDNLLVDFHDPYNKEEITKIVIYPTISPRLDAYWIGGITVRDFEGALFEAWYDRDFNKILIEDNSDNVLFRGFLIKKVFEKTPKENFLTLTFAGIGVLLDWEHFGADGYINYILAEGLIKAPISSDPILLLKDNDGNDFTWAVDWWIEGGRNTGLLIVDKTDVNTRTWDSSAISQVGGTVTAGNNASTTTFNDSDSYNVKESTITPANPITIITPVIDGVAVDDTDYLKSIQIEYNFRIKTTAGIVAHNWGRVYFEILKDTTWITVASAYAESYFGTESSGWVMGIPISVDGGNGNEYIIEDTDAELQKFFNKTGATYTSLKGMRFRTTGDLKTDSYFEVHVEFVNVVVGYMSDDITAIMERVTDNAASTITSTNITAWDETGVVENDGFKIGESTRTVIQDIASQSGLNVEIKSDYTDTGTFIIRPNTEEANTWVVDGAVDANLVLDDDVLTGEAGDGVKIDKDGDATCTLGTDFQLPDSFYCISAIRIYLRAKKDLDLLTSLTVAYKHGATTSSYENIEPGNDEWAWDYGNWSGLELNYADLEDLQIIIKNERGPIGGTVYVDVAYARITYRLDPWNKYMAREFKGNKCMEPLKAVCKLEGAHWYEDYINNKIVLIKLADFEDSTVDLTEADYEHDWRFEDECNQVKSFFVFGKSEDNIFAKAVDESVSGYISKQLIDESITNVADAQEIADAQLALLNSKRPSIKLKLKVDNVLLQLGTTAGVTMVRPTVAEADYPIRMIERSKFGALIKTVIYCGLGESPIGEEMAKVIRDNAFRSHKSLTDRLISP